MIRVLVLLPQSCLALEQAQIYLVPGVIAIADRADQPVVSRLEPGRTAPLFGAYQVCVF